MQDFRDSMGIPITSPFISLLVRNAATTTWQAISRLPILPVPLSSYIYLYLYMNMKHNYLRHSYERELISISLKYKFSRLYFLYNKIAINETDAFFRK